MNPESVLIAEDSPTQALRLQNMLENLQTMGGGQMSPEQKAATEALEKLGSMIGQQRNLMDKTFREQEANRNSPAKIGKLFDKWPEVSLASAHQRHPRFNRKLGESVKIAR